jgi:hypothetical protein
MNVCFIREEHSFLFFQAGEKCCGLNCRSNLYVDVLNSNLTVTWNQGLLGAIKVGEGP